MTNYCASQWHRTTEQNMNSFSLTGWYCFHRYILLPFYIPHEQYLSIVFAQRLVQRHQCPRDEKANWSEHGAPLHSHQLVSDSNNTLKELGLWKHATCAVTNGPSTKTVTQDDAPWLLESCLVGWVGHRLKSLPLSRRHGDNNGDCQ